MLELLATIGRRSAAEHAVEQRRATRHVRGGGRPGGVADVRRRPAGGAEIALERRRPHAGAPGPRARQSRGAAGGLLLAAAARPRAGDPLMQFSASFSLDYSRIGLWLVALAFRRARVRRARRRRSTPLRARGPLRIVARLSAVASARAAGARSVPLSGTQLYDVVNDPVPLPSSPGWTGRAPSPGWRSRPSSADPAATIRAGAGQRASTDGCRRINQRWLAYQADRCTAAGPARISSAYGVSQAPACAGCARTPACADWCAEPMCAPTGCVLPLFVSEASDHQRGPARGHGAADDRHLEPPARRTARGRRGRSCSACHAARCRAGRLGRGARHAADEVAR